MMAFMVGQVGSTHHNERGAKHLDHISGVGEKPIEKSTRASSYQVFPTLLEKELG